ncbi:MAG: MGMT family protein [Chloroflexi bacterium]|nr:MGMT family protein [Chloroflexota bacterium]
MGEVVLYRQTEGTAGRLEGALLSLSGQPALERMLALDASARPESDPLLDDLARRLRACLQGEAVAFPLEELALERCGAFQQQVLRAEHAIPRGSLSTYGRIAAHIGRPGAARAVGTALGRNPFPILIPCHRAVRSDGSLGGYAGGLPMKRALLQLEGITLDEAGRAPLERLVY